MAYLKIDGIEYPEWTISPNASFQELQLIKEAKEAEKVEVILDKEEKKLGLKNNGKEYLSTGITVPFKNEDALGLLQVKAAFELGQKKTVMEFSNGQKLPLTAAEFPAFAKWFTEQRNSFFL